MNAILIAMLFLIAPHTKAQNLVQNGSLETGFTTCHKGGVWNNGPFYLGENLVDNWTGLNYGAGSSNHPVNSGAIFDNTATCTFGDFPSGISAYKGNRSAQVYASYTNGALYANWAKGNLTKALDEGCYWVCIATANHEADPNNTVTTSGIVEVLLASSTSAAEGMVLRYIIPANSGWSKHKSYFKLLSSDAGIYDRILIRIDGAYLTANSNSTHHVNNIIFDDVSIAPCTSDPDLAVADAGFNYAVAMEPVEGGDAPVISTTANDNSDLYIHRWDILVSDDQTAPESEWTHLDGNSGTVLEDGNFNSGTLELASVNRFYKLIHLVVSPCYGWAVLGKMVEVKYDGAVVDHGDIIVNELIWEPEGDEINVIAEDRQTAPEKPGEKAGEAQVPMYEVWPNPPVNEITIIPSKYNTDKSATVKCLVFDSKGATVVPTTDISENNTINISALPTGVYYVQIISGGKIEIQKFIK